jgi:hypothetical protein
MMEKLIDSSDISDETLFSLCGEVNSQKNHFWSVENLRPYLLAFFPFFMFLNYDTWEENDENFIVNLK